jgi:hypothetical protein
MYIQRHDIVEILLELALNTNQSIDVHIVNSKLLHDWDEVKVGGVLGRDSCNSPRPVLDSPFSVRTCQRFNSPRPVLDSPFSVRTCQRFNSPRPVLDSPFSVRAC